MTVWTQLEPLLAKVQKPARYIGCEDGVRVPEHGPGRIAWLLLYPDTYEIGLPNQGLQILYEILNERPDALAERSYAPWIDLEAEIGQFLRDGGEVRIGLKMRLQPGEREFHRVNPPTAVGISRGTKP